MHACVSTHAHLLSMHMILLSNEILLAGMLNSEKGRVFSSKSPPFILCKQKSNYKAYQRPFAVT